MKNDKRNLRLYKLIDNVESCDNLLNIYKQLRGKENLEKRLFLKAYLYASLHPKKDIFPWMKPSGFFAPPPKGEKDCKWYFTMPFVDYIFKSYMGAKEITTTFGHSVKNIYGFLS